MEFHHKKLLSCIKRKRNPAAISIMKSIRNLHDMADSENRTLLHYAAEYNNPTITQYLIDNGCNIDALDIYNNTPLIMAVFDKNVQVIRTLLNANAKIGDFVLEKKHVMTTPMILKSPEYLKILKMLFDKLTAGCLDKNDVAQKLFDLHFPVAAVIFLKNADLTRRMINLGCSIDDVLSITTKETALHVAVFFNDLENIKLLVNSGANINSKDYNHCTPLLRLDMFDCNDADDKIEILTFLLERGASFNGSLWIGKTFETKMLSEGTSRTLRLLIPHIDLSDKDRDDQTPVHHLVTNTNPGIIEVLKGQNYDINVRDESGWSPLDFAADSNNVDMVEFLLKNGANVNNVDDFNGFTTLITVITREITEPHKTKRIVELLLQYGADLPPVIPDDTLTYNSSGEDNFIFIKPLLAHLALVESTGKPLHEYLYQGIESSQRYKYYFELCKLQVEKMKNMIMYESVTLYMLLFERCEKKIAMCAMNQEFVSNYELFVKDNKYDIDSYYISTLVLRADKTIDFIQTKEKTAIRICEIIGLPLSMISLIGYNVLKYLERKDMDNVLQI